jgi:hypothetical protein
MEHVAIQPYDPPVVYGVEQPYYLGDRAGNHVTTAALFFRSVFPILLVAEYAPCAPHYD